MSVVAIGCRGEARAAPRRPVRLSAGESDTAIINSLWPTALPVWALDAEGRVIPSARIRYAWAGGANVLLAPGGEVRCSGTADAVVRATVDDLTLNTVVLCRPVRTVRLDGPIQFILGDSLLNRPQELSIDAYGSDGRAVTQIAGVEIVKDTTIAVVRGHMIYPRTRGITTIGAHIGDADGGVGIHVYQRVPTLDAIDTALRVAPTQRLFAVPLSLEPGEFRRQRLPPGNWMLTMLPEDDSATDRTGLRVEGAACQANLLNTPRRWGCHVENGTSVVVYLPLTETLAPSRSKGPRYLLVRWLFS